MQRKTQNWEDISIIFVCILAIIPIIIISYFNRPCADDYDYALITFTAVKNGGNLFNILAAAAETSQYFYNNWQGLYTSAFFLSLQPGIFGETYYRYSTIIIIGFCYIFLFSAFYIINKHFTNKTWLHTASISAVIMTLIILWMPSPTQGLFWYNGAMNYLPWVFATLLNLCLIYDIFKVGFCKKITIIASIVLSFIISGANHVTAFANILYLFVIVLVLIPKRRYYAILPFISACIGFAIMYVAHGTAIRQSHFVQQSVIITIIETLKHIRVLVGDWCTIEWIVSLILITPFVIRNAINYHHKTSLFTILFCSIINIGVLCGMLCVPYFSMGSFGATRIYNVFWSTFILQSYFIYFLVWNWLINEEYVSLSKIKTHIFSQKVLYLISMVCITALVIMPSAERESSSLRAVKELKNGAAQKYCAEMDKRIALYNDSSLEEVAVPPLETKSTMLFYADLGKDPNQWSNTSIGTYYNKLIYISENN